MKIKKTNLDTYLIICLMYAVILPTLLAQTLILILISLVSLKIIFSRDLLLYINVKLLIFILILPGIYLSFFFDLKEFVRYSFILIIVFGFPFSTFEVKILPIFKASVFILLYLIFTQIFLALDNQLLLDFREFGYKNEFADRWNYTIQTNLIKEIFSFNKGFRAGGLYHNPNILAGIILLFFFIFSSIQLYLDENKNKFIYKLINTTILIITFVALLATKSRTVLIVFAIYLLLQNIDIKKLLKLKVNKKIIIIFFITVGIFFLNFERIIEGTTNREGSFYLKFFILINYILQIDLQQFLFGGTFDIQFDAEYGKLFGAYGLSGIIAFSILLRLIYKKFVMGKAIVISFLIMGFGTTVFLNLQKVIIILILLIVLSRINYLKNLKL